ncbi:MAG: DNA polymerase III subunit delta [Pseudomonadota bacterium]
MKVFPERLTESLQQASSLAPIYLIAGPERLLVEESCDAVRAAARQQQVSERIRLLADGRFKWHELDQSTETGSLFASTRLVEVRMPTGKPGAEGGKAIRAWLEAPRDDVLLLICDQWELAQERSAWFKAVDQAGVFVPCWTVKPERLEQWIAQRLHSRGLQADRDTARFLAARLEGNLLAAAQEVERLVLLLPGAHLTLEQVRQAVADHARFDAFRLVELVLTGQTGASLRCIRGLQEGDTAPPAVLWALGRELEIASAIANGESAQAVFKQLRVWSARQGPIRAIVHRMGAPCLNQSLATLSDLDRMAKGQAEGDFWIELERLCSALSAEAPSQAA